MGTDNATKDPVSLIAHSEAITWCVMFSIEALVAVATNIAVIIVFLKNTRLKKQTTMLLVNLGVADLLVGVVAIPGWVYFLGAKAQLWHYTTSLTWNILYSSLDIAGAFASVTNHGCIAVERLIATLWPFKYRRHKQRITAQLIAVVWVCAILIPAATTVGFHVLHSNIFAFFVWMPFLFVLLLVIAISYTILLCRVKTVTRDLQQETESRNTRFTVTVFIVTVVSLIAWLPFMIMSSINMYVPINTDLRLVNPVKLLHFLNSLCSFLIYWFRIPHFKKAACQLMFRRKSERGVVSTISEPSAVRGVVSTKSEPSAERGVVTTKSEPSYERGVVTTKSEPSAERGVVTTKSEPSAERGVVTTKSEPSAERGVVSTKSEPSAERGVVSTKSEPSAERRLVSTKSEPSAERGLVSTKSSPDVQSDGVTTSL